MTVRSLMALSPEVEEDRSSSLLNALIDTTPDIIYAKDLKGRWILLNSAAGVLLGKDPKRLLGCRDRDLLPLKEAVVIEQHDAEVFAGRTVEGEEQVTYADGSQHIKLSLKSPLRDRAGKIIGLVGISRDITASKQAREREMTLAFEVDHRANNLLALIQSFVRLTKADTIDDYKRRLGARIEALARSHNILADKRWDGADLRVLLSSELSPYGLAGHNISLNGPPVLLRIDTSQSLALAFHELTSNAVSHGALYDKIGKMSVAWDIDSSNDTSAIKIIWIENLKRAYTKPEKLGFGLKLMKTSIEAHLKGQVTLRWLPARIECEITVPIRA